MHSEWQTGGNMGRLRISVRSMLAAVLLASSATAGSSPNIFQRQQAKCVTPNFNQCAQAGLPDNFCCPASSTCIVLAANTTVLCCPQGSDCTQIQPIICDITAQDATLTPNNTLKTTALSATLGKCGSRCCPFGYTCNSQNNCERDANQDISPIPSGSSTSSLSATATSTASSTSSSTTAATSPSTNLTPITANCEKFPVTAVLAGFFPGLVLGVLLTIASICLLGARRRKAARRQSGSSFGNISEPQLQSDLRTDFLRKAPMTPSTVAGGTPTRQPTIQRVRSLFQKSQNAGRGPMSEPGPAPPVPLVYQKKGRPVTPPLQRELSYENINIFADGDTASALRGNIGTNGGGKLVPPPRLDENRGSHQTTFTDMMERSGLAGLQKGQPYIYKGNSPGYTPGPRSTDV